MLNLQIVPTTKLCVSHRPIRIPSIRCMVEFEIDNAIVIAIIVCHLVMDERQPKRDAGHRRVMSKRRDEDNK